MRFFTSIAFIFFSGLSLFAQLDEKELRQKFNDAEYFFLNEDYEKAAPLYTEVYDNDPTHYNACYKLGLCFLNIPLKQLDAIDYLEIASEHTVARYRDGSFREKNASVDAFYFLGVAYHLSWSLDDAISAYERYKVELDVKDVMLYDRADRAIKSCERASELIKESMSVEVDNIGHLVNTNYAEFNPAVSENDSVMYFTRANVWKEKAYEEKGISEANVYSFKIMRSYKLDSVWQEPEDITAELNTKNNCVTLSISKDGKTMLLYRDEFEYGDLTDFKQGSIFISHYQGGSWQPIEPLPNEINSLAYETHACISSDGNTIYFTSNRKGGFGGMDIYKSTKDGDQWGEAENMGDHINTEFEEETPFIVNDSILYFASDGHDNMGGYDIFYSKLSKDGKWSVPTNVGIPVNSAGDDLFFVPIKNGAEGYYAVARPDGYLTFGKEDIFHLIIMKDPKNPQFTKQIDSVEIADSVAFTDSVEFANAASAQKAAKKESETKLADQKTKLNGRVSLKDENLLEKDLTIQLLEKGTNKIIATAKPDLQTGKYEIEALPGEYNLVTTADNYLSDTLSVLLSGNSSRVDISLTRSEVASGEYFMIKAVFFGANSYELDREAQIRLEKLFDYMDKNPQLYVEVVGHTDAIGSKEYNLKLSQKRSRSVIDYLVEKGISSDRFVSSGKGEDENIASNDIEAGRKLNRRVEIKVVKGQNLEVDVEAIHVPEKLKKGQVLRFSIILETSSAQLPLDKYSAIEKHNNSRVFEIKNNDKYVYYTGDFKTEAEALKLQQYAQENGFPNARRTDYFELNRMSSFTKTVSLQDATQFTVQLAAAMRPIDIPSFFSGLEGINEHYGKDGYYRYTFGLFNNKEDARKLQKTMIDRGFTGAFLVNADRYEVLKPSTANKDAQYTIQFFATSKPVSAEQFKKLKGIKELKGKDNLYHYIYGEYSTWEDAQHDVENLKKKGHENIFIKNLQLFK